MTKNEIKSLQRDLNKFYRRFLKGYAPLRVDGEKGPGTNERIRDAKFYLGFWKENVNANAKADNFIWRLNHPRTRKPGVQTLRSIARGVARRRRHNVAWLSNQQWGGSRYYTNKAIRIVGNRAAVTSRKRVETFGNPDSDHHVSQKTADAVDFGIANAQSLMDELARRVGGPSDVVDFQRFFVRRRGKTYRIQIIAATHGTGPHLHFGVRRA